MYEIIDKLLLFIGCTTLYILSSNVHFAIIPVIIAILLCSLFMYFEDGRIKLFGNILFLILCTFMPEYIIFVPLLMYDIFYTKYQFGGFLIPLVFILNLSYYNSFIIAITFVLLGTAYLLKQKTDRLKTIEYEFNELRDSSTSISLLLEEKNRSLLKNQDYEINLATLNERNRISKELHDNIGHLISRSLLQVGAMLTIAKEELLKEGLTSLKDSLSNGMDQIRNTIHQLYDESIDLYAQITHLVKDFSFCPIDLDYDIKTAPALPLKHNIIGIMKEALANIIRHSNATKVSIILREHPALYQLVIKDNGTMDERKRKHIMSFIENNNYIEGMGLNNISDRVKEMGGNLYISLDNGFKLFISIPKKDD